MGTQVGTVTDNAKVQCEISQNYQCLHALRRCVAVKSVARPDKYREITIFTRVRSTIIKPVTAEENLTTEPR